MWQMLLHNLFNQVRTGAFEVAYWDNTIGRYGRGDPSFRIIFRQKVPYRWLFKDPVLAFGEAYMEGAVDFDGDWDEILKVAQLNRDLFQWYQTGRTWAGRVVPRRLRVASPRRQQQDVQYHYDLGNDFYALWLDETMSYSCAYFQRPEDSLGQAQIQKTDHVLRKLQLRPGETLLDVGSGWGRLIIQAAQEYGAQTMGITLSQEQFQETRRRIAERALADRVEVGLMDYRELAAGGRTFDKIASVGMFEHVGQAGYPGFMRALSTLLNEGGLALLHTITHTTEGPVNAWISKYIFPGGHIPSLREIIWLLPEYGFHVLDVESLRMHYAMTLDRWAEGFDRNVDRVRDMYGDRFVRMWRLYLRSCAASFRVSGLDIHQILFSKNLINDLPLTRELRWSTDSVAEPARPAARSQITTPSRAASCAIVPTRPFCACRRYEWTTG